MNNEENKKEKHKVALPAPQIMAVFCGAICGIFIYTLTNQNDYVVHELIEAIFAGAFFAIIVYSCVIAFFEVLLENVKNKWLIVLACVADLAVIAYILWLLFVD